MNNKITVLVLEHNQDDRLGIEGFYGDIIKSCGYDYSFIFKDKAEGDIIDAKKNHSVFDEHEIDLFITDISLGYTTEGPFAGLKTIKKVKEEFPELIVIANSSKPLSTQEISQHNPSFDLFVDKTEFQTAKYKAYIAKLFNKILNRNVYLTIDYENSDFPDEFHKERKSQRNKLVNLLKFVTFNSREKECSVTRVVLKKIEDGNSGSFVFQMEAFLHNELKCINSIIKISNKDKARVEKDNYDRFVKWNLPYTWRVELLAYAEWQDYGCICYSYAFDGAAVKSVTEYIKDNREEKLLQVLDTIFNPTNVTWYNEKNLGKHPSITRYYFLRWFDGRKAITESIDKIIADRNLKVIDNRIQVANYSINNPKSYLFADKGKCTTCICHGDLNSNNILLSESSKIPVFIDFQDTGMGHVFVDFVVFENSLRLNYNQGKKSLEELIAFEIELNKIIEGKTSAEISTHNFEMYDTIIKLRQSAFDTFLKEKRWAYIYGLAMSSYARLRDLSKLSQWQINQIFASLLAAIHTLSNIKINTMDKPSVADENEVFACYNSNNKEFVIRVVNDLASEGVGAWFDGHKLRAGDSTRNEIEDAIKKASIYLVFIGEEEGPWQSEEIHQIIRERAKDKNKTIIPCIVPNTLEPAMPGFLSNYSFIDFNINYPQKLTELASGLKTILARIKEILS